MIGNEKVSLLVNGTIYRGWLSVSLRRTIKAISGGYSLGVTDVWTKDGRPFPVIPGDECTVKFDEDTVITGYVDDVNPSYNKDTHSISVEGRDKAADLVDCSAGTDPGEHLNISLEALAKKLCTPFGITVKMQVTGGGISDRFPLWKVHPGESVFETLDRAAKTRQVLIFSDGLGSIIISRTGTTKATTQLVEGKNILEGRAKYSHRDRYSRYTVKSQLGGWSAEVSPDTATGVIATSTDATVKRFRPLEIVSEASVDTKTAKKRVDWEKSVRQGRSSVFTVDVEGFRQGDGTLWLPNTLVQLKSPWLGVDRELLITEVSYQQTSDGSKATLELEAKEAFDVLQTKITARDLWDDLGLGKR